MDKELDENIKPVDSKECCRGGVGTPNPNCCKGFSVNTLPAGVHPISYNSLSHKEKYDFAITHKWKDLNGTSLKDTQPEYDPNKQNFEPK